MITLTCITSHFLLASDQCDQPPTEITVVGLDVPFEAQTAGIAVGPIPKEVKDGVHSLNLTTPCGCFTLRLYLKRCPAPRLTGLHTPTNPDGDKIAPECCPDKEKPTND